MKLVNLLLLVSIGFLVSGCNTARGVGADLELLGRKMQGLDNNQVIVEGLPPENVVEVPATYEPTTYESDTSYQSDSSFPSYDSYSSDSYSSDSYSSDSYSSDSYSAVQTEYEDSQVYTTPYEGDTTYTTLPDAITYPVED